MRAVAALAALLCCATLHADRIFVTNERGGTIAVIDSATDRVIANIAAPARPRGIVVSPDRKRLFVAVSHFRDKPSRTRDEAIAIDATTMKVVQRYAAGTDPEGIALTPDGARFVVSNEDAGTASIVDAKNGKTLAALVVGTEPEGVAVSGDGRVAYVTGETSNTISVIDLARAKVSAVILTDTRPRGIAFTRNAARAYVTCEVAGMVDVIDVKTNRIVNKIALPKPSLPVGLVLSGDEKRLYVATGRGNSVVVIDTIAGRVMKTIPVGKRPWGIALTRDGKKLYVANGLSNDVTVIDVATSRAVTTIRNVGDGPWGVAALGPRASSPAGPQASRLRRLPGGETPPSPAAGTAALPAAWYALRNERGRDVLRTEIVSHRPHPLRRLSSQNVGIDR